MAQSNSVNVAQPDITIFKQDTTLSYNDEEECNYDHKNCPSIICLSVALQYYSKLDITNNENDQHILIDFMSEVYPHFLNDNIHFHTKHGHQIEDIHNDFINDHGFGQCEIGECSFTSRHHQSSKSSSNSQQIQSPAPTKFAFYKEAMDALHFYIFHMFHVGLRSIKSTIENEESKEAKEKEEGNKMITEYYDAEFMGLRQSLTFYNGNTDSFERFGRNHNSKFTIKTEYDQDIDEYLQEEEGTKSDEYIETYLESILSHLKSKRIDQEIINNFVEFLKNEDYDTDAVSIDILDRIGDNDGNIMKQVPDPTCARIICEFIQSAQMSSGSFSIGLRFYYWPFYKDIDQLPDKDYIITKIRNHDGYKVSELYVEPRYDSFAEEIRNYSYIDIKQYKDVILVKANAYINTNKVKSIKADPWYTYSPAHYEVEDKTPLGLDNLISVILYCDYTALCSDFSSTFRKTSPWETISSIKHRNTKYWWLSKTLRETVELFTDPEQNSKNPTQTYYTGMSYVMYLPSFSIRLCSPTSTSVQIAVACKFSGDKGLILQLNVGRVMATGARAFDCSWLSRFREEDERLYFGGFFMIGVESIRLIESGENFETATRALYYLDSVLSNCCLQDKHWKLLDSKHVKTLQKLMDVNEKNSNIHPYIKETFNCFIKNKTEIYMDLSELKKDNEYVVQMTKLFMNPLESVYLKKKSPARRDCTDNHNIFKRKLLDVFKYTKRIIINAAQYYDTYIMSLIALLEVIKQSSVQHIQIILYCDDKKWRRMGYSKKMKDIYVITDELKSKYINANYQISNLKPNTGPHKKYVSCDITLL